MSRPGAFLDQGAPGRPGSGRRFAAGAIDWTICGLLVLVAFVPAGVLDFASREVVGPGAAPTYEVSQPALLVLSRLVLIAPILAYYTWFRRQGQTIGMDLLGIRLTTSSGSAPSLARSVARSLWSVVLAGAGYVVWLELVRGPLPNPGEAGIAFRALHWAPDPALTRAAVALLLPAILDAILVVYDPRGRTFSERVFGLRTLTDGELSERSSSFDNWLRRRAP